MKSSKEHNPDLEQHYIDCFMDHISEIQVTELEYGDWGKMLIGLRLIGGHGGVILECGDFEDVDTRTIQVADDERVVGIVSRTFGMN